MNSRHITEQLPDYEAHFVCGVISLQLTREGFAEMMSDVPAGSIKSEYYGELWDSACRVHGKGGEVNIATVADDLWAHGKKVDAVRMAEEIAEIVYEMGKVRWYGEKIAEIHRRLKQYTAAAQYSAASLNPLANMAEERAAMLAALDMGEAQEEAKTLSNLMGEILQDVESGEGARPMPTPWANLNRVLKGGICPGELVVLAARPGMGKTALAGCMAVETARRFGPVLFVSCEVKDKTLGARMLAREGRIDNRAFREGLGNSRGLLPTMREAAGRLSKLPLQIIDTSTRAVTPAEVRRMARRIKGGPRLIVVDYLQLMFPDQKHDSREREIAEMSRSMKRMSVELNCPVLLLSQLNRRVEENAREPQLSDLRESGSVEQDADIVIMLHAERKHINDAHVPLKALVRKGRSSGTGAADLMFEKEFSDFKENTGWREERNDNPFEL